MNGAAETAPARPAITSTGPAAVETHGLTKRYAHHLAVDQVDLRVETGQVFGYLGPNGAGKTTTIRMLTGLLRPSAGRVRILGTDVTRDRDRAQRRIGYLPGTFVAYPDLTADEYLRFLARLRGDVSWSTTLTLAERLKLDLSRRISTMSHGNKQKVGIVQALMHRPSLAVFDEPTAGLDPLIQREFLDLVREIRDDGRTVFLSSHVMSEVEAVADTVGILRQGQLVVVAAVDTLKSRTRRRMDITFGATVPQDEITSLAGVTDVESRGNMLRVKVEGSTARLFEVAAPHQIERVVTHEPDLEEIFLSYYEEGS